MRRATSTSSRPEPDTPAGPDEPIDISAPAGPANRPKPESQHGGPFPIPEPAARV